MYERWGALVVVGLAGAGIASVVMGFSVWFVALFCLLALVGAVDMLSTMSGGWETGRVGDPVPSQNMSDGRRRQRARRSRTQRYTTPTARTATPTPIAGAGKVAMSATHPTAPTA